VGAVIAGFGIADTTGAFDHEDDPAPPTTASTPASPQTQPGGTTADKPAPTPARRGDRCEDWNINAAKRSKLQADLTRIAHEDILGRNIAPGGTIVVGCGAELLAAVATGTTDGANKPSVEKTEYDDSSGTKFLISLMMIRLEDQGVLKGTDRVGEYIPGPLWNTGWEKQVTINDLLRHQSGLVDDTNPAPNTKAYDDVLASTSKATMRNIIKRRVYSKPGTHDSYSNNGFVLAGKVMENATHKSLDRIFDETLVRPLHLEHTGSSGHATNCAPTSMDANPAGVVKCTSQDRLAQRLGNLQGNAGAFISAGDGGRIMAEITATGQPGARTIFKAASLKQLSTSTNGFHRGIGTTLNAKNFCSTALPKDAYCKNGYNGTQFMGSPDGLWSVVLMNGSFHRSADDNQGMLIDTFQDVNNQLVADVKPRA
jgi:CubicO group peptidase (beta-lactamase class C family)